MIYIYILLKWIQILRLLAVSIIIMTKCIITEEADDHVVSWYTDIQHCVCTCFKWGCLSTLHCKIALKLRYANAIAKSSEKLLPYHLVANYRSPTWVASSTTQKWDKSVSHFWITKIWDLWCLLLPPLSLLMVYSLIKVY